VLPVGSNAIQGNQQRCLDAGMDDYVSKPVRIEELEAVVRRWVALPARQSEAA